MTLSEKINSDMINYMKSKDSFSLGVIRMVKGAIQLEKINLKRDLNDEEVIGVISKQIKMRNDSIAEFTKANRLDLVEQYKKEIELLNKYIDYGHDRTINTLRLLINNYEQNFKSIRNFLQKKRKDFQDYYLLNDEELISLIINKSERCFKIGEKEEEMPNEI